MQKTSARYVRAICLYIHVTVGQEKRTEQSGVINNKDGSCHYDMDPMDFVHDYNEKNKPEQLPSLCRIRRIRLRCIYNSRNIGRSLIEICSSKMIASF